MEKISGNIYIENVGIKKCSMTCENGVIAAFGAYEEHDALPEKQIVVPGFIDKHIHGAGGADCMNNSAVSAQKIADRLPAEGVTSFLCTTMTAPKGDLVRAVKGIFACQKAQKSGARILGVHLEGPFISTKKAGAQPVGDVIPFDEKTFEEIYLASGKSIKQVTFAPEGNEGMAKYLSEKGVVASVGHTAATAEQVLQAAKEGATSATHIFNAMSGISHRNMGALGGVLLSDNMMCELIADGKHVEKEAVRLLYKTVGKDRIVLVSDSTEAKYLDDGRYKLGANDIIVRDGIALLADGTIAGSVLKMNDAVRNMMRFCGVSLPDAVDMATVNAAKALKAEKEIGTLAVGKYADYTVIDGDVNVFFTHVSSAFYG